MGFTEFEKLVSLIPEQITEDEKENLFPVVINLELELDVSGEDLAKLFRVSQEILKFKGEQVESLISELDHLAGKLGEIEAKRRHGSYVDDVEGLRSPDSKSSRDTDYHRELVKMEIQNNQLMSDLQEKEQELINEKKEVEKLTNGISVLEDENRALKNELHATQQELASNASMKSLADDQDYPSVEKYHELTELLRQKNKHITQLLNDIEDIEKENITLKDKLSVVRHELADGAEQMSKLSMERLSLSAYVDELKANVSKLEQENAGIRNQVSELVADKEKRDKQFESVSSNYELKLQKWQNMLEKKDTELTSMRVHSLSVHSGGMFDDSSHVTHFSDLKKIISEREEKILELQQQLEQATVDLNESSRLLELYKNKFDESLKSSDIKQLTKKLEQYKDRMSVLEAKANHAEEESLKKAEEVSELIIQLREYESGTYGLEEAMARIKELQKQKQVRDNQIEQLVHNSNQLQDDVNLLEQENQILRERLGISSSEQIVVEDISRKTRDRYNKLTELNEQLEKCQNELLSYRLENRKLKKQISTLETDANFFRLKESSVDSDDNQISSEPGLITRYTKNLSVAVQSSLDEEYYNDQNISSDRLQDVIDENESLRKGMHEILDSIRVKDVSSIVQIESETLERLLEALDSRHVAGWYQPAMRLQAHIHHLNGINQTLREELHSYKQREEQLFYELHDASRKLETRDPARDVKLTTPLTIQERRVTPKLKKSFSCAEDVETINPQAEKNLEDEKKRTKALIEDVEKYREKLALIEEQLKLVNEQYDMEKKNWSSLKASMQTEIEDTKNREEIQQVKANEYEKTLETLKQSPEEMKRALVESTLNISSLKIEQHQLNRKYEALLEAERQLRLTKNKLSDEMYSMKVSKDHEIIELRKINDQLSIELKNHIMTLTEYVNHSDHDRVVHDLSELTVKHRQMLHKQILVQSAGDKLLIKLQNEMASLQAQKTELEVSLKIALEEKLASKSQTADQTTSEQVAALTKQLATLELDILNRKQAADHVDRMYELTREQFTETENRCKKLEDQLALAVETNGKLQTSEASLKDKLLKLPNSDEFEELNKKLKDVEHENALLRSQKDELEELANIAQDQVKSLEQYNRYQDFEFDSLQRRVLELQSHSDEKVIIDRLTNELLLLQQNGMNAHTETTNLKDKLAKCESELLQTKVKLGECENNYNRLKRDSNSKIRCVYAVLYELQKRYLGSFPLIKEELCFENLMHCKEESYALTSLVLDMKPLSVFDQDETENERADSGRSKSSRDGSHKFALKIQDFNMRLINEGLRNKIQIYAERLDRQDKLITRLEQEIIHADEQCEEFLLYWNPHSRLNLSSESEEFPNTKFTQTINKENTVPTEKSEMHASVVAIAAESPELNQANRNMEDLLQKLQSTQDELRSTRDQVANLTLELKDKVLTILDKEKEILDLQRNSRDIPILQPRESSANEENCINNLALKTTVDNLQNIISQKEEIIKRLQTLMKKNGEEHAQSVVQLLSELKTLQDAVEAKNQTCNRLTARLDALEKPPNEKRAMVDQCLTKIHELEDELNQANEKVQQLTNQLEDSNQQAELWSHTAEERLQTLQNMKHELDSKRGANINSSTSDCAKLSYTALLQVVKEKTETIERQNHTIQELQKRLESSEKLPGYRDRWRNELEKYKKKVDLLEQREKEEKNEIQRLKSQLSNRPLSARKRETIVTAKEELLLKKIKTLEEQIEEFINKEKKWTETRRAQIDGELEKWQNKKRVQQIQEKLRQQIKDLTINNETLKMNNDRLKETIVRLEKERMTLDSKLKNVKSQIANATIVEELQKANSRLEEEVKMLHRSLELTAGAGSTSLTEVIETQERKIRALELGQKSDYALAEEVERLNERKSQLQKYVVHLEEEKLQLKLENERLRAGTRTIDHRSDSRAHSRQSNEDIESQLKGNQRKNSDLEKAVLVLRRVVQELQSENKRLHDCKINKIQDKSQAGKMQIEMQTLHENYLDAIERVSILDKELENANKKIQTLHKIIERLQNGEEISSLRVQLAQKTRVLNKAKIFFEKFKEKELLTKASDLSTG